VPEHRLDIRDIGAAFQHQSGYRVPEKMAGAALADFQIFPETLWKRVI